MGVEIYAPQTVAQFPQVRRLLSPILSGVIPHVRAGAKYLVNYDGLLSVLAGGTKASELDAQRGQIRRIY